MKMLELLWYLALPVVMPAPQSDNLVAEFSSFLEAVRQETKGKWPQMYPLPDAQEELAKDGVGWVSLTLGYLDNLQNMSRAGDCTVQVDGHTATATANVYIDSLEYSYDFSTNSKKFSDVTGCAFGSLDLVRAQLTIVADLRNTSAVTATVQSMTFQGYGVLVTDEASMSNVNDDFTEYLSFALMSIMDKKTLPFLGRNVENFINNTLRKSAYDMSSVDFTTTTTTTQKSSISDIATTNSIKRTTTEKTQTNKISTSHPSTSNLTSSIRSSSVTTKQSSTNNVTSTANSLTVTNGHPSTNSANISQLFTVNVTNISSTVTTNPPLTNKTTDFNHPTTSSITNIKNSSTTKPTIFQHHSINKTVVTVPHFPIEEITYPQVTLNHTLHKNNVTHNIKVTDSHISRELSPRIVTVQVFMWPDKTKHFERQYDRIISITCRLKSMTARITNPHSKLYMKKISYRTDIIQVPNNKVNFRNVKDSVTSGFNKIFDTLFNKTDVRFLKENMEPFKLPDGEEKLYETTDGSVKLADGSVFGLDTMMFRPDPTVKMRGSIALVSVGVYFTNITYSFNFSTDSRTFSRLSGIVCGNVSELGAELSIVANLTKAADVTATLKTFRLLPTMEFSPVVEFQENVTGTVSDEISDAIIADFNDNITQRLQDSVTQVLLRAVAKIHRDMRSLIATSTSTSSSSHATVTTPKPSSSPSLQVFVEWYLILTVHITLLLIAH